MSSTAISASALATDRVFMLYEFFTVISANIMGGFSRRNQVLKSGATRPLLGDPVERVSFTCFQSTPVVCFTFAFCTMRIGFSGDSTLMP